MASPPPQGHHWHFPIFCQTQKTQILLGKASLSSSSRRKRRPLSLALQTLVTSSLPRVPPQNWLACSAHLGLHSYQVLHKKNKGMEGCTAILLETHSIVSQIVAVFSRLGDQNPRDPVRITLNISPPWNLPGCSLWSDWTAVCSWSAMAGNNEQLPAKTIRAIPSSYFSAARSTQPGDKCTPTRLWKLRGTPAGREGGAWAYGGVCCRIPR